LFSGMLPSQLESVVQSMEHRECESGSEIITQGETGTEFMVLESGTCEVFVDGKSVLHYKPGSCFGELALIYNAKRAATIRTTSTCTLWVLSLSVFRHVLSNSASQVMLQRCEFLKGVKLLEPLSNEMVTKIAGALREQDFSAEERIITQGEQGETFFLIQAGTVKCSQKKRGSSTNIDLVDLGAGEYFGEMALMLDEPRHANVVAKTPVKCLLLDRRDFNELLGPLQLILAAQMRIRILRCVPLLSHLPAEDLDRVSRVMRVQQFQPGEFIIREGEHGTRLYIINDGDARVTRGASPDGSSQGTAIGNLTNQDFFGERALFKSEPRMANVIAIGPVECLVLEQHDFRMLLHDLRDVIEGEIRKREQAADQAAAEAAAEELLSGQAASAATTDTKSLESTGAKAPLQHAALFQDLEQMKILGAGTFGRVKLVQDSKSHEVMALKCMYKTQIVANHQARNILNEKTLLLECSHPFVLKLFKTYESPDELFMLMELVQGGELWSLIYDKQVLPRTMFGGFETEVAKFYAACVVSAFQHIHAKAIAYRDLKPENLLLDGRGFLKVIDFGFAKKIPYVKDGKVCVKTYTICGTPEYLSPELIRSSGHDRAVDYWALGCLIFELLIGCTPFADDDQSVIFRKVIGSDSYLKFPGPVGGPHAEALIRALLTPNPTFRLGNKSGGVEDIMKHKWFEGFDWVALVERRSSPPYVPRISNALDTSHFDDFDEDGMVPRFGGSNSAFNGFVDADP